MNPASTGLRKTRWNMFGAVSRGGETGHQEPRLNVADVGKRLLLTNYLATHLNAIGPFIGARIPARTAFFLSLGDGFKLDSTGQHRYFSLEP